MAEVLKSDIFFFVSTIAVIIITVVVVIAFIYLIRILRHGVMLSHSIRQEGEEAINDIRKFHKWLKEKGMNFKKFFNRKNIKNEERNKQ